MKIYFYLILCLFADVSFAQIKPGNVTGVEKVKSGFLIKTDQIHARVQFYASDIVRIDYRKTNQSFRDSTLVIIQKPDSLIKLRYSETESSIVITTDKMKLLIRKRPLNISFYNDRSQLVLSEIKKSGYELNKGKSTVNYILQKDDHFYGTGERGTGLDKRGMEFESYNRQLGGYRTALPTLNLNAPILTNTNGYAIYFDNYEPGHFDLGAKDSKKISYSVNTEKLCMYVILASTIPEQLEKYTWLTGRQPLPPKWAFGFMQSKNHYQNEAEVRGIVETFQEKKIPLDAIILDLAWFKNMGDLTWNTESWPNHEKMVLDFKESGIQTILITEPYLIEPSINFKEADSLGFLAKDSNGKSFILDNWWSCKGCNASLLDITNPDAQKWWWSKHIDAFGENVAGIWTDLGEPERHPTEMNHYLGSADEIHNIYNLLWSKTIFDGFNELRPNSRVMNLTRSGFSGSQRYGIIPWSGDVSRTFGGLAVQIPMVQNMGMSGFAYHNSDIGGYGHDSTSAELYVRWMQYGTFSPITRAHGAGEVVGAFPTEPWMFGKKAEEINAKFISLRYQLMPYIYTLAFQNYKTGLPLVRPLFWLDETDEKLLNDSTSYMWGDAFLVAPVIEEGQKSKSIYLPKGKWFDYWTDKTYTGGKSIRVETPLDKMPLFVKSGSIIPMVTTKQTTQKMKNDTLFVHFYIDDQSELIFKSTYTLYEDDGETLDYQKGNFTETEFSISSEKDSLGNRYSISLNKPKGSFEKQVIERVYKLVLHGIIEEKKSISCSELDLIKLQKGIFMNYHNYDKFKSQLEMVLSTNTTMSYHLVVQ